MNYWSVIGDATTVKQCYMGNPSLMLTETAMRHSYTQPTQQRAWGDLTPGDSDIRYRQPGAIGMAEAGKPVLACPGLAVCRYDTAAYKDSIKEWKYDLLHHYLIRKRADPLGRYFRSKWAAWEKAWRDRTASPNQHPADRHEVYNLLVSSPEGNPTDKYAQPHPLEPVGIRVENGTRSGKERA